MLEQILEYERAAFLWLNGNHNPFWDSFMWLYTGQIVWIPMILLLIFFLFYKKDIKEVILIVLSIILLIALCDQLSSSICKPYFSRFRPTHHPDFKDYVNTVNDYRGGRYGFISGHATNAFGFAMFALLLFRNRLFTISILLWGILFAYSRIYLGVHFISDIIPGILAGLLLGFGIYKLYMLLRYKILKKNGNPGEMYPDSEIKNLIFGLLTTVTFMLVYSFIRLSTE
jgi:Membrane-associated phospholipid phosphatase